MERLSDVVRGRYNRCKYCGEYNPVTGRCARTNEKVVSYIVANVRADNCPKDRR